MPSMSNIPSISFDSAAAKERAAKVKASAAALWGKAGSRARETAASAKLKAAAAKSAAKAKVEEHKQKK